MPSGSFVNSNHRVENINCGESRLVGTETETGKNLINREERILPTPGQDGRALTHVRGFYRKNAGKSTEDTLPIASR